MGSDDVTDDDAAHAAKMRRIQAAKHAMMAERSAEKGLLIVNTGAGKGKSTAAFGMAMRAVGHGMRVGIVQFVKGTIATGEQAVFDAFPDRIDFKAMGEGFTWDTQDRTRDIAAARAAWAEVARMIADPAYALVVADELNIVLRYDYLPLDEILAVIAARAPMKHVVVTGRNAPAGLIEAADLVTEMTVVKHPYREQGIKAQRGIEF